MYFFISGLYTRVSDPNWAQLTANKHFYMLPNTYDLWLSGESTNSAFNIMVNDHDIFIVTAISNPFSHNTSEDLLYCLTFLLHNIFFSSFLVL